MALIASFFLCLKMIYCFNFSQLLLAAYAYLLMKCLKGASSLPSSSSVTMSSLSTLAHRELFRDSRDDTEIFRCAI